MIKKTLALYVASAAALGAVLTACGGSEAPRGPELTPQTATVAPEPRPEETHADRDDARDGITDLAVDLVWDDMVTEDRAFLCFSFSFMTHDEIVDVMTEGADPEDRDLVDWDRGTDRLKAKCDAEGFTSEGL